MKNIKKERRLNEFLTRLEIQNTQKGRTDSHAISPIFTWTGHPFTDAGLVALLLLSGKEKPEELTEEDVKRAVKFVAKLYSQEGWAQLLARIYRNNNPILMINPSMRKYATPDKLEFSLWGLYQLILSTRKHKDRKVCQICGRYPVVSGLELRSIINTKERERPKEITGDIFPLLGTGDLRNYFPHGNEMGADICAHCLFLAQLSSVGSYVITTKNGKTQGVLIVHAYPYEKMVELNKAAVNSAKKAYLYNTAEGFKQPVNFLFELIRKVAENVETGYWEDVSISAYYYLNGNRTGEQWIEIFYIPNPILRFVAFAARKDGIGWKKIVLMGWRKRPSEKEFEDFKKRYPNDVYSKLLSGESILPYFLDIQNRKVNAGWNLLSFYCSEVLGLDKEALEFIKGVADRIVETVEKLPDNKLSRRIRELERAEKLYQFESFFIRVEKDRQEFGIPEALMSFDDFARILTSYGEDLNVSWKTVKNLLLFRIYEKLHDRLMKASLEKAEVEEAEEEFEEGVEK
ncbi:CRISPR-associated protein Cst1 [Thermococcus litoralis DSM 5473]|uniref:CRISPR-associated protein Cst1 n=1 Tax=Thermococcus litoralis (strain ATCC 51850 / DSM 5473 / JCM 8560 / NS-C) TaxID=523849 RepID=H3ZK28_THELN|nr:type I-B CRISPR-associated protein Cas8b1/Cst1 [Thermococcus litoralis]EHR79718.1 CRISPR-associated protein Cst1 [Thermococcus litoralis DSM 5473]